jgi:hypothetical protein
LISDRIPGTQRLRFNRIATKEKEKMPLLVPSSRVFVDAGETQTAKKFVLASREWFELQNSVQAVLALPFDFGEYTNRYGDASSGLQMKECFDAMHKLRQASARYGNPKALRQKILKDPNFLAGPDMPVNDAYSAIAWTVQRAHLDAASLASILRGIPTNARGEKPADVVAGIKTLFLGTDQLVDRMRRTQRALDELARELRTLQSALDESQVAMETFTARSSTTRIQLDEEIGALREKIAKLERDRDNAYQKWLALTISAVAVSAGIAIAGVALSVVLAAPSAGTSLAVGSAISVGVATAVGGALGVAAGIARTSYEDLVKEVSDQSDFLQKRITYRNDLGALDSVMKFSLPASKGLIHQVEEARDGWASSIEEIRSKVSDLSVANLSDGPWLDEQEMKASSANWTKFDDVLKAFVVGSFVDYDLINFGSPLPKDDPNWLKNFVQKAAA